MYKKEYAAKLKGYWAKPVEDYEYWLRLTELCDIRYIPVELMDYRENSSQSVSAKLQKSIEAHRHWRYMNNLIKQQARKRRNIPVETTIFFIIQDEKVKSTQQLEKLLDQLYYNYSLLILDISRTDISASILKTIKDPRIQVYKHPGFTIYEAMNKHLLQMTTPFAAVYDKNTQIHSRDLLGHLVNYHHLTTQNKEDSVFMNEKTATIQARNNKLQLFFGDLYPAAVFKNTVSQLGGST